ncbi:MAG TPA: glycosyltransferase family protein [Gemmatimonadales bacterium]|nr:glycosyltransferase family protein [Gemmatimonadales bacterium]
MIGTPVVTVVQARSASTRLPSKVLLPLGGQTVLERLLERVQRARLRGVVVLATTADPRDDRFEGLACAAGVLCYRGHATDLLDRHYQAARLLGAGHVVKIPSDCPLIDPAVIDRVLGTYFEAGCFDYVSNLHPPTYPDGNDVEIASIRALEAAWREAAEPEEREHTTPFLWRRPERFRSGNVRWEAGVDCSQSHRVVLDYREDYDAIAAVFDGLHGTTPWFGVADVVRFLDEHPEIAALNAHRRGDSWYARTSPEPHAIPGALAQAVSAGAPGSEDSDL